MAGGQAQPAPQGNKRLRQGVGDMVRSMAIVLAVVAVIVILAWRPKPEAVKVVPVTPVVNLAVAADAFPVLAPTALPDGWRPTSARFEPTTASGAVPVLHVGYVTPSEAYAQVTQSPVDSLAYLAEQTDKGEKTGTIDVGDTTWQTWEGVDRRSLVRTADGVEIVVSGSADWPELGILAASLQKPPVSPSN